MTIGTATDTPSHLPHDHPCFGCAVRSEAVCNALEDDVLGQFRRSGHRRSLSRGEALCWESDPADHVFSITKGVVRLAKLLSDGRRQIIGFAFPGDFLGLTMEEAHPYTVEAIGSTEACQFARSRFADFLASHPGLERRLFSAAAAELAASRDQLLLLGRKSAPERVASFILHMVHRSAQTSGHPLRALLPMSRIDIADYLGLRIETISRELGALKADGVIRMEGVHQLHVLAPDRLAALAAGG